MKRKSKRKSGRSFFIKVLLVFNLVMAGFLLLSYLAAFINPRYFWPVSFFGLAYPWLFLINLLLVIFWLFKEWKLALISAVCILIGYNWIVNSMGFRESAAIDVPKSSRNFIRIMTYNVHYFKKFDYNNDKTIKNQILDVIRREQPDVICIQEFWTRKTGEYHNSKTLREILQTHQYYFEPYIDNNYEAQGLAIFSKYPIKNKGRIRFPNSSGGNEAIYSDIQVEKKQFRIYNVHLQSISFQPEDYKYLKEVTEEINTNVQSSRRIGSLLKKAFLKRSEQALLLKKETQECRLPYIIAGDFNDTPASFALNTLSDGLKNAFREKGSGFGITYNGEFPNFQIDYILTTNDFNIKSYRIIDKKLSDHYAVRSDVEFSKN
ncbi:endonuclease/exonuclease/phosphatase family protein [Rubrolithibacter danxiaensis]|uniref:endonuclease/exonuclease/phosphatase family protein n=1 Tax=Rubrolithibacter danxiaensis TaxID=3390805 RepID=UPI003BF8B758